jgi:hypothetical protein
VGLSALLAGGLSVAAPAAPIRMTVSRESFNPSVIQEMNGVVLEEYRSFFLVEFPPSVGAASARAVGLRADPVQDPFLVGLGEYPFHSDSAVRAPAGLPPGLTREAYDKAERGLYIVQFYGPIKDAWLDAMKSNGVEILEYLPSDSYVVRMTPVQEEALGRQLPAGLAGRSPLQWSGIFQPAYKVSRELSGRVGRVAVSFMVVDDAQGNALAEKLMVPGNVIQDVGKLPPYLHFNAWIDAAQIRSLAFEPSMYRMSEWTPPVMLDEPGALNNAGFRVNGEVPGFGTAGIPYLTWLFGRGFDTSTTWSGFVVNVTDTGLDKGNKAGAWHHDLYDPAATTPRVAYVTDWTSDAGGANDGTDGNGHGTKCAGVVGGYNNAAGSGLSQVSSAGYHFGLGVAPLARIGGSKIFKFDGTWGLTATYTALEQNAYAQGARISSNSWGSGVPTGYDAAAREYDSLVRDSSPAAGNQENIIVFSAGNFGPSGTTLSSPGSAKNVLTLAAAENWWPDYTACGWPSAMQNTPGDDIVYYSSRGPTNDGRRKPDLAAIANGWNSLRGQYAGEDCGPPYDTGSPSLYGQHNGTSAACPAAAGSAALIYQDSLTHWGGAPSPAMVKAILAGTARDLVGGVDCNLTNGTGPALTNVPNNSQGWGLVNVGAVFGTNSTRLDQREVLGATGDLSTVCATVDDTSKPVRIVVAWTDAPGNVGGLAWKNDLNLEVVRGADTYLGNVLSGGLSVTGGSADGKNNLEQVILPAGTSGPLSVKVRAVNIVGDGVPSNADPTDQDFALYLGNASQINPPDAPTAGNGGPVCEGTTLNLTVSTVPGATYSWTGPNGFASSLQDPSIASVTLAASGMYTVTVSVPGTCTSFATTVAVVVPQACNDGSVCTQTDTCAGGVCVGGNPVTCTAGDSCHVAGVCDPASGCPNIPLNCDDGSACTTDGCNPATGCVHSAIVSSRFASSVVAFSSEFDSDPWSAQQALGPPDVYPVYGDSSLAWASLTQDDQQEFLDLAFDDPAPINFVIVYETSAPGAVSQISVMNPNTGLFQVVWTGAIVPVPPVARAFTVTFPLTPFPVSEVRVDVNSPAVFDWNEIDAVAIGVSGSSCDDGNACTDDGCTPTAVCSHTNNVAVCDDGNGCTAGDVCGGGVCNPGVVIAAPQEVQNVAVAADKATYSWSAVANATQYDVVRGSTGAFPVGPGGGDEVCFGNRAETALTDPAVPAAGTGFWYLSRGENTCGAGTFGTRSNGSPRTTTTCP